MQTFKNILIPIDFEQQADEAVRVAAGLACRFESSVTLAHVYDPRGSGRANGYAPYTADERKRVVADLHVHLDAIKQRLQEGGVQNVETCLLEGMAAAAIVRCAEDGKHDLIVMGTHGRKGIWLKLLGSVAQAVLNDAPCAVLTVRGRRDHLPELASQQEHAANKQPCGHAE